MLRQPTRLASSLGNRFISNLLHGNPSAKMAGDADVLQHSRIIGRHKYIHGFEIHRVKPDKSEEYKKAAERYYTGVKDDAKLHVKLTGSWETIVGEQDTFFHILEYEHYGGYDRTAQMLKTSEHLEAYNAMLPFLNSRTSQLNQEFAFFPSAPPHAQGGVFELRTYQLKPGTLLEWEHAWRKGIEARRQFVAPVGAWFSQIGRLHQVHHMWQYPSPLQFPPCYLMFDPPLKLTHRSLEARKETREKAWQLDGWAETVDKTSQLAKYMDSFVLSPLPYSPLK